ncbi:MAG TPA: UDP-N-acetylmuramate--L-alanine ligase, partial [Polyangiales bacterium]|nr:UDP-N-acetylmuramate--L-alanine ligase [Polyangiales bacterium]
EPPIAGADSAQLALAVAAHGHRDVTYVGAQAELVPALLKRSRPGDIVITLGAGSITRTGPELIRALEREPNADGSSSDIAPKS